MTDPDPIEDARRARERIGAERYLGEAVTSRIASKTGRSLDELRPLMQHFRPDSFTNAEGEIDDTKIDALAGTLGSSTTAGPRTPYDPVADALARARGVGDNTSGVAAKRHETFQSMIPKGQRS